MNYDTKDPRREQKDSDLKFHDPLAPHSNTEFRDSAGYKYGRGRVHRQDNDFRVETGDMSL